MTNVRDYIAGVLGWPDPKKLPPIAEQIVKDFEKYGTSVKPPHALQIAQQLKFMADLCSNSMHKSGVQLLHHAANLIERQHAMLDQSPPPPPKDWNTND